MLKRLIDRLIMGESRHELMNYEWQRFESFKDFSPAVPVSTILLAKCGFYYTGRCDTVRCFSCSYEHSGWQEGDVPADIHRRLSPTCDFMRGTEGGNVPIRDDSQGVGTTQSSSLADETNPLCKHPNYIDLTSRIETFQSRSGVCFESSFSDAAMIYTLSDAGFFYTGNSDFVKCFSCGGGLRGWAPNDDPWTEHAQYFPWCPYLRSRMSEDFIKTHSKQAGADAEPDERGGQGSNDKRGNSHGEKMGMACSCEVTNADGARGGRNLEDEMRDLKEENNRLRDQVTCKICLDMEPNVVFLPCSHLVACEQCAPHVTNCVICRHHIKSKKKVFLS